MLKIDNILGRTLPSLEAIDFQINSKFGPEIEEQFDRLYAYAEQWNKNYNIGDKGVPNTKVGMEKVNDITNYCNKIIGPNIKAITQKHTGIRLAEIYWIPPILDFCIDDVFVGIQNTSEIDSVVSMASEGYSDVDLDAKEKDKVKMIQDINDSYDYTRGKIHSNLRKFGIIVGLPLGAPCLSDLIRADKVKEFQQTPAEMASSFLHEIGHIFTWFETGAELGAIGVYGNSILRQALNDCKNDPKIVLEDIKTNAKIIQDSKAPEKVKKATKEMVMYADRWMTWEIPVYFFSLLLSMLSVWAYSTAKLLLSPNAIIKDLMWDIGEWDVGTKNTRETKTYRSSTSHERLADEYVSRLGYAKEFNSGLIRSYKLAQYMDTGISYSPRMNEIVRNSRLLRLIEVAGMGVNEFHNEVARQLTQGKTGYEPRMVRLKRNVSNLHDVLNRYKLPRAVRLELVSNIDSMEKSIKRYASRDKSQIGIYGLMVQMMLIFPKGFNSSMDVFSGGQVNKQYAQLFDQIDGLLSNKSGYYRTKLEELA